MSDHPHPPADGVGAADDATLLAAIAEVWSRVDPAPVDLADGVLARIAAEDLEFELLTLVESEGALAGVRHASPETRDEAGSWLLEYHGPDERIYVRLSRVEDRTRLDGWVVPARSLTVHLQPDAAAPGQDVLETTVDEFGRFEFTAAAEGLSRLTFTDVDAGTRPRATPPFWI